MTSMSGPTSPDDDDRSPRTSASPSKDAPGAELGLSGNGGGTFEPEEAPGDEDGPDD